MNALRRVVTHPVLILSVVFALLPFVLPRIGSTVSLGTAGLSSRRLKMMALCDGS